MQQSALDINSILLVYYAVSKFTIIIMVDGHTFIFEYRIKQLFLQWLFISSL